MAFELENFKNQKLNPDFVNWLVEQQWPDMQNHFARLWDYYENTAYPAIAINSDSHSDGTRFYIQAQEIGLPARITGIKTNCLTSIHSGTTVNATQRKEVVIENDIAWRINAMVDFLFGKNIDIVNKSPDRNKRSQIDNIIKTVINANGGIRFFLDMAVLGSVYGFVDCIVRPGQKIIDHMQKYTNSSLNPNITQEQLNNLLADCNLELIEAPRAVPVLNEKDYKKIDVYIQHFIEQKNLVAKEENFITKIFRNKNYSANRRAVNVTEIISSDYWQRYENQQLVAEGQNVMGVMPVVHIQNIAQPMYYEGISDVEKLMTLQDELNTRLSDRANRITFQAFKMYLVKGIENVESRAISPGRVWCTENVDADIQQFGGDEKAPSENVHIDEIRQALDKASGVTPVAAGIIKGKIGNLTSSVALKMTLMGMLAKTNRKQFAYGQGIKEIAAMVMNLLDVAKIYPNQPQDRIFDIIYPSPLPENTSERLEEAKIKQQLGLQKDVILRELGYEINNQ